MTFDKELTVRDLIAVLQKLDQDAIVVGAANNFELNGADVPLSMLSEYEMIKVERSFRDAFDGNLYEKEVYRIARTTEDKKKSVKTINLHF